MNTTRVSHLIQSIEEPTRFSIHFVLILFNAEIGLSISFADDQTFAAYTTIILSHTQKVTL